MDELVRTLNRYGIDTAQLQPLYDVGPETTYYMSVPGVEALAWWEWLRKLTKRTGYWPVLLGHEELDLRWHQDVRPYAGPSATQEMIAAACAMDAPQWFKETLEDEFAYD